MSHPARLSELLVLKERGYHLLLTFITTDDPERNVERVALRYRTGTTTGHYVPPEKVRERYHRTLALLPRAAELADTVFVYDNSVDFARPSLQVVIDNGTLAVAPEAKKWVQERLVGPLQQRDREFAALVSALQNAGHSPGEADELDGAYRGAVLYKTAYYLAQLDTATNQAVIHDRLMLDTAQQTSDGKRPTYAENETLAIEYSRSNGPRVERAARLATVKKGQTLQPGRGPKI
jgi:hypothetical protein